MEDKMYGQGDLRIEFQLKYKFIKDIYIEENANEHGTLVIRFVAQEKVEEDTLLRFENEPISVYTTDNKPVFHGIVNSIVVQNENAYTEVIVYATTKSILADREKKTKTLQSQSKTLSRIAKGIKSYDLYLNIKEDLTISEMLSQEDESDFHFTKRVANANNQLILVDSKTKGNPIHIGALPFGYKELSTILSTSSSKNIYESEKCVKV